MKTIFRQRGDLLEVIRLLRYKIVWVKHDGKRHRKIAIFKPSEKFVCQLRDV